jgi:hypothetical protein
MTNIKDKVRIVREQLPIEPAFAVTGHSTQGKMLLNVIVDLHEGGFGAYVAASCARTRQGLCTTEPVTIEHLNKPVPHDLLQEVNHLRALEHNTIICHGFQQGDLIAIPDPESECQVGCKKLKAKFVADDTNSACNKQPAHQDIIHPQAKALKANVSHIKQSHMPSSANTVWQGSTGSISSQISRAPSAGWASDHQTDVGTGLQMDS